MIRQFTASVLAIDTIPDLNAFTIVLAEDPADDGERLELQRALSFDEQDRELGQDTYCLSTSDGASCYGGIQSSVVEDHKLTIRLDRSAADTLGTDVFVIGLDTSVSCDALRSAIRRMMGAEASE